MQYPIYHRYTGKVMFTAEIDCDERAGDSVKRGLAVRWAVGYGVSLECADLRDAYLGYAKLRGTNLAGAHLRGANLRGANLIGSNLAGAYLRGANFENANIDDANLRGAYLKNADLIHCGTRSDGYEFYAHVRVGKIWIKAGSRYFPIREAKAHWEETRAGTQLGEESFQLLKNAKSLVKIRGLLEGE